MNWFKSSVTSIISDIQNKITKLEDLVAHHHNQSELAKVEQDYHTGERDLALRVSTKLRDLIS